MLVADETSLNQPCQGHTRSPAGCDHLQVDALSQVVVTTAGRGEAQEFTGYESETMLRACFAQVSTPMSAKFQRDRTIWLGTVLILLLAAVV